MRIKAALCGVVFSAGLACAAVGGGDVIMKNRGGDVTFSHETHVTGAGLRCTDCHDRLYLNSAKHRKVTMKQIEKGKSCGACHDGKKAFSVKGECGRCHAK